jgi:arsenate reductase (glutaredoxin)
MMKHGIVKFFNASKGFGFITDDEGGKEVFVPAASVPAESLATLQKGQRVTFEVKPDPRGPKAVNLTVLAASAPQSAPQRSAPLPKTEAKPAITVYFDPGFSEVGDVLAELRAAGHDPQLVNYVAAPPVRDELKRLSSLLRNAGQELVKRFDPLFFALNLDDRFISENDFWDAIVEHPALINGPIVVDGDKASVCRSGTAVRTLLAATSPSDLRKVPVRRSVPGHLFHLVAGASETPSPEKVVVQPPKAVTKTAAQKKTVPAAKPKDKTAKAAAKRTSGRSKANAAPAPTTKRSVKKVGKQSAKKVAKKAARSR